MDGGIRKTLTFVKLKIASKIFGKIIRRPLEFRKDSSCPRTTEQIQILQCQPNPGQRQRLKDKKYVNLNIFTALDTQLFRLHSIACIIPRFRARAQSISVLSTQSSTFFPSKRRFCPQHHTETVLAYAITISVPCIKRN